ncbi:extensin family protein [Phaeobacter sp. B1627]|uniref:extensin-like domain-containing protein n=1 Tax=Phaeobacter sp. B1627 TaxID=2583809 RepID=UPI0011181E2B|nr:extensin family protein [Phaeobacter sp. B1627]TNJ48451.1 extensin family protein [Phaeobacter sp. B1627]
MRSPAALCLIGLGLALVGPAAVTEAAAPDTTPRPPLARLAFAAALPPGDFGAALPPGDLGAVLPDGIGTVPQGANAVLRPRKRPPSPQVAATLNRPAGLLPVAPETTPRPTVRSPELLQQVLFGRAKKRRGSVCGSLDIQGEEAGHIPGTLKGCGARNAVRVRSVAGVQLSTPALMTCDTAKALHKWVKSDVEKAFGRSNRVTRLRVAAHYSCRTRNNRPGARISEHGRGRAIDISGFGLEDGTMVSVLKGWRDKPTRRPLRRLWKAACGPFRTVLGPEADIYHRDHFHLDVARHRSGRYCR